jgi:hypothetical protein
MFIMDIGLKIKDMVKENILGSMAIYLLENGIMIKEMVKVKKYG